MNKLVSILALALGAAVLSSCSDLSGGGANYTAFKSRSDYRKTSDVYRNQAVYDAATTAQTSIRIDLSDQRAQLRVGPNQKVARYPCPHR